MFNSTELQKTNNTEIALQNGSTAKREKLQQYFSGVFEAEKSGEQFAVNLDHVWRIGYGAKEAAVKALKKVFMEGVDYQALVHLDELEIGSTRRIVYYLTVSCAEYFAVRANRDVFEVYVECRKAVQAQMQQQLTLPSTYKQALLALVAAEEEKEQLQLQVEQKQLLLSNAEATIQEAEITIQQQKPKVDTYNLFIAADSHVDFETLAKNIAHPKFGKLKILQFLREEQVLMTDRGNKQNYPYASYTHFFKVTPHTSKDRMGIARTKYEVLISPRGQEFIVNRAKRRGIL